MEYLPINDLPNEILEIIFDHLDVDSLKHASLVCRRWSDVAFCGRQMERVTLVPKFPRDKDVFLSNRKYRHIELKGNVQDFAQVKELFQMCNVSSLRKQGCYLSYSSLRFILLEVPNLQHLSIDHEPGQVKKKITPLPVMRKLERLEIKFIPPVTAVPWHTIAPSLQGLKMFCDSEDQLEQWKLFSGQLKQAHATFRRGSLLERFCEITFALLEELSLRSFSGWGGNEAFVRSLVTRHQFFRRNASLRRLRLEAIYLCKTLVQDISNHNKKLTSLEIIGINRVDIHDNGEQGSLESLAQLTELKHLRLENLNTYIFRGCEPLTSLQSLCINEITFGHEGPLGFLADVFKIASQLKCLELGSVAMPARAVHFICNKFTKLTRLQLTYSAKVTSDGFSRIERLLTHLTSLTQLTIPRNKVRYLTLYLYQCDEWMDNQILLLPQNFPQLERLNLFLQGKCLRESTVARLRKLLPTYAIITYGCLDPGAGLKKDDGRWKLSREMMSVWDKEWAWRNLYS